MSKRNDTTKRSGAISTLFGILPEHDAWVRPYFGAYRKELIQALVLGLVMFIFAAMLMFASGYLISRCAERPEGGVFVVLIPVAFVQIFGIGKPILRYIERLVSHDWVFRMTSDLRLRLYTALESQAMRLKREHRTGDFLGLVAEDIGHLQNLYLRTIFPIVIGWGLLACVAIFYGIFDILFALAMLVVLAIVAIALPLLSVRINRARTEREKAAKNELYSDLTDNVLGSTDWVFSGRGSDYLAHAKGAGKERHKEKSGLSSYYRLNDLITIVVMCVGAVIVYAWSANYFGGQGLPRADWIAAFVLGFFPLAEAFMPLTSAATQANTYRDSVVRLNEYPRAADDELGVDAETLNTASAVHFAIDDLMSQGGTQTKSSDAASEDETAPSVLESDTLVEIESVQAVPISVENVSFAHEGTRVVLDGISLDVPAGQKLAILGRSGSGKSTLVSLIRGNLTPDAGRISIGGTDVKDIGDDMPHIVGTVQQSPYLFNRTLRDNLLIGRADATDDEIWAALKAVELFDMVSRLPKGLDTMVDEAGTRFSGGERHRIALARVLLSQVGAILLDEPTVGLDPITESALLETLFNIASDKTVVMVTHHLQDIERFDRVIFVENGRIELDGSPAELMRTSERFRALRKFDFGVEVASA